MSLLSIPPSEQSSQQLLVDLQQIYTLFDTCINDGSSNAITIDKLHYVLLQYTGVNYTEQQIIDMISSVDTNHSGDIQFTEFLVAMNKVLHSQYSKSRPGTAVAAGTQLRPKTSQATQSTEYNRSELIRNVFNTLDTDNDGYIEIDDLKLLYENNGVTLSEAEIHGIAYMVDVNQKGRISYTAFEKLLSDTQ